MSENIDILLAKLRDLEMQNRELKSKHWASLKKQKHTAYFILVNTNYRAETEAEKEYARESCAEMMQLFKDNLPSLLRYNKKGHSWDLVDDSSLKYVVEFGHGRKKCAHLHIYLTIYHHSNVTLTQERLEDFFSPLCYQLFGSDKAFVCRPRLIPENRVEEYMQKDGETIQEL